MTQQYVSHRVGLDPVHASRGVDLWGEVGGEEAITFQAPGCHQDEHAKRCVAESESLRLRFRVHADHQVDALDVALDPPQLLCPDGIVGQLLERGGRLEAEQPTELVVSRDAAFADPEYVDGPEIDEFT